MSPQQLEESIVERIHREPFVPLVVELNDGQAVHIPHPRLSINGGGAVLFGRDGGLVDIEFGTVRSIRVGVAA